VQDFGLWALGFGLWALYVELCALCLNFVLCAYWGGGQRSEVQSTKYKAPRTKTKVPRPKTKDLRPKDQPACLRPLPATRTLLFETV
jgi:hypothetical protein